MSLTEDVESIVQAASAAAVDGTAWPAMLQTLRRRFDASAAALHTPRTDRPDEQLLALDGLPADSLVDYVAHWHAHDPWFEGAALHGMAPRNGRTFVGSELCDWRTLRRTAFFNDFARRSGVQGLLTQVVEDGSRAGRPLAMLALYRPPGHDEFTTADRDLLHALWGPLSTALRMHWQLARRMPGQPLAGDVLAWLPCAALVLAEDGRILHANPRGCELLAEGQWLGAHHDRLQRLGGLKPHVLAARLRQVAQTRTVHAQTIAISRRPPAAVAKSSTLSLTLAFATARFSPVPAPHRGRPAWPGERVLLLIEEAPPAQKAERLQLIAQWHGLTPAETRLVEALDQGLRPSEFAQRQGISTHTARTHLRHVFDKLGVRRQSELLLLLGGDSEKGAP